MPPAFLRLHSPTRLDASTIDWRFHRINTTTHCLSNLAVYQPFDSSSILLSRLRSANSLRAAVARRARCHSFTPRLLPLLERCCPLVDPSLPPTSAPHRPLDLTHTHLIPTIRQPQLRVAAAPSSSQRTAYSTTRRTSHRFHRRLRRSPPTTRPRRHRPHPPAAASSCPRTRSSNKPHTSCRLLSPPPWRPQISSQANGASAPLFRSPHPHLNRP